MSAILEFPKRPKPPSTTEALVDAIIAGCGGDGEKAVDLLKQLHAEKIAKRVATVVPITEHRSDRRVANARGECKERELRKEKWDEVNYRLEYLLALRRLGSAARYAYERANVKEAAAFASDTHEDYKVLDRIREAELQLLLTPAPTVGELNRKKALRRNVYAPVIAGREQRIDASIAQDEEWLKANAPVRPRSA